MKHEPLTTGQIAEYCHVSLRTVLNWIADGKLAAYRTPGKHSRVKVDDFLQFLKQFNMPVPQELGSDKFKVLIVDDDQKIVDLVRDTLSAEDLYLFREAHNGFEAGQKFSDFRPDLVTLDINMPGMDGYEVCSQIRNNPDKREVKILIISGLIGGAEQEKIDAMGADDTLGKPFTPEALKNKIATLTGAKRHGSRDKTEERS